MVIATRPAANWLRDVILGGQAGLVNIPSGLFSLLNLVIPVG
jgi:hypothetical protein